MNFSDHPFVSIITPVYNGARYLPELIASVAEQDYPNIEHIIIDDGSNDDGATVAVLRSHSPLRWWSRENRGQYATMNEGLEAARGEMVCFVSADDLLLPGAVKRVVTEFSLDPNADGVVGQYRIINQDGSRCWYQPLIRTAPLAWYPYLPFIAHCSLYVRSASLKKRSLYFNDTLRFSGDYDWMSRMARSGFVLRPVRQDLSAVRWHASQASTSQVPQVRKEMESQLAVQHVNPRLFHWINAGLDRIIYYRHILGSYFKRDGSASRSVARGWLKSR